MSDLITQDKDILGGKPIIKGTRMSILELLASGMSVEEILKVPYSKKGSYPCSSRLCLQIGRKIKNLLF